MDTSTNATHSCSFASIPRWTPLRIFAPVAAALLHVLTSSAQAQCPPIFVENFDTLRAPLLPTGWTASQGINATSAPLWVTSTVTPYSAANDAFSTAPGDILDNRLDTSLLQTISFFFTVFRFYTNYDLEAGRDGAVLEVSAPNVNGGAFTDVTDPAVSGMISPGYNSTISTAFQSPIAGRQAWSGNSGGWVPILVDLTPLAQTMPGQIRLRFRLVSDNSNASPGWRIDQFIQIGPECSSPTPSPTLSPTPTSTPIATPCGGPSLITDSTFEAGMPWPAWTIQTSTNFGTPLCNTATCGTDQGFAPPYAGDNWAWFGGANLPETATFGQTVVIPVASVATLNFLMRVGWTSTPFTDVLNLKVDDTIVASYPENLGFESGYKARAVDLSAFADGGAHFIMFEYIATTTGKSNYIIDNITLNLGTVCSTPTPSPTPTATPTATATATATVTATATATPTVPTSTPTPTPDVERVFWEGFDTVTAPALPPGWVTSSTSGPANCTPTGTCTQGTNWRTSTATSQTAPNAAFHNAPGCVTDSNLDTLPIFIPTTVNSSVIYFWQNFNLEAGHDGGVLEISIEGGAFTDIVAAGGSFWGGGYNGTISTAFLSPIGGRQAWTGSSGSSINTSVSLPLAAKGHNVVFRFRLATDCSGAGIGWYIDSIQIAYFAGPTPTPTATFTPTATPTATAQPTPSEAPHIISGTVSYCSNPVPGPVPNVVLTLTGVPSGSTQTDTSGNYMFSNLVLGQNYTVTPSKTARAPGSAGINTVDLLAIQRHFIQMGPPITGCRFEAADCAPPNGINTVDVLATQKFFLQLTGTANVGRYSFQPTNRSYSPIVQDQTDQNYDAFAFGDVVAPFVH